MNPFCFVIVARGGDREGKTSCQRFGKGKKEKSSIACSKEEKDAGGVVAAGRCMVTECGATGTLKPYDQGYRKYGTAIGFVYFLLKYS